MKTSSIATICGLALAAAAPSHSALAKQSKSACVAEWRANKAEKQAAGVTKKAFVAQCRAGGASPTAAAAPKTSPAPHGAAAPGEQPGQPKGPAQPKNPPAAH